jgi:hypothetical protein
VGTAPVARSVSLLMGMVERDPGLPIKCGPCANGEFVPPPLSPVEREAVRRARCDCDANAKRLGMSRAAFLRSVPKEAGQPGDSREEHEGGRSG